MASAGAPSVCSRSAGPPLALLPILVANFSGNSLPIPSVLSPPYLCSLPHPIHAVAPLRLPLRQHIRLVTFDWFSPHCPYPPVVAFDITTFPYPLFPPCRSPPVLLLPPRPSVLPPAPLPILTTPLLTPPPQSASPSPSIP
eukprot:Sspe_Gene.65069::Locus_38527_Transcript_1_1_Confidence_1.000_Length_635::g.65069::m.65069